MAEPVYKEELSSEGAEAVVFRILRFNAEKDKAPAWAEFEVPVRRGMTVLDGLSYIKENLDSSLSWRSSCRMGVCGSCGMFVNGLPRLACQNQVRDVMGKGRRVLEIKPLPNYDLVRDLVTDFTSLFEKHRAVQPYLIREDEVELRSPKAEFYQAPEELQRYLQFSYCIKCGLCVAACPTAATDEHFLGPQALAQAYRFTADSRDEGFPKRRAVAGGRHGVWKCHFAGECSHVCPKGVDPAFGQQLLKRELIFRLLRLKKARRGAPVVEAPGEAKPRPDLLKAPEPTVKGG